MEYSKIINIISIFLVNITFLNNCTNSQHFSINDRHTELVFKVSPQLYNLQKIGDTLKTPCNFIYNDSFMLLKSYELYGIHNKEIDTSYFRVAHYRFEDLRNKVAYFYKEFTPEAKLWGKLPTDVSIDSQTIVHNYFYLIGRLDKNYKKDLISVSFKDTMINDILFKRYNVTNTYNSHKYYSRYWAIKNDTMLAFSYLPKLSKENGLAFVKYEISTNNQFSDFTGMNSIELERNYFTAEERKVFDAWRKNCTKYKDRQMGLDKDSNL